MYLIWIFLGLFDTILKGFQYGWMILLPSLIFIIVLIIKRKSICNYRLIISLVLFIFFFILFTSRLWGPKFYIHIIGNQIENKESLIEEKLEKKYKKNFTFLLKEKTNITDSHAGWTLGGDITYDYSAIYKFVDDDGVVAIVEYKKDSGWDYYQIKRAEYDIEQAIYDYAKKIDLEDEFYVKELDQFEDIRESPLDDIPENDFINKEMGYSTLLFVMPKKIDNSREFISNALESIFTEDKFPGISEYIVTENEYQKIKNYYESDKVRKYLSDSTMRDRYDIDDNNTIHHQYYYVY